MSDSIRNKLASQIIKAEMLGDEEKVKRLKTELANLSEPQEKKSNSRQEKYSGESSTSRYREPTHQITKPKDHVINLGCQTNKVKKFLSSTSSLSQMFVQEKNTSSKDDAKMFMKNAAKFSRDDMETKYFAEEIDDSQVVLNKSKKHKPDRETAKVAIEMNADESCRLCDDQIAQHLVIQRLSSTYVSLWDVKPFLSSMGSVIIRNTDHSCDSFISADESQQAECQTVVETLKKVWKSKGYKCIIMETYLRNRRPATSREFVSCGKHFQIHCLPIREKHYEEARMYFKQALEANEKGSSINRTLIRTNDRRIQRCLPKGLSYFWVCFDSLTNGFGHIIESEQEFSRYFGFEVMSNLAEKEFKSVKLDEREDHKKQFERCRDLKLLYSQYE